LISNGKLGEYRNAETSTVDKNLTGFENLSGLVLRIDLSVVLNQTTKKRLWHHFDARAFFYDLIF